MSDMPGEEQGGKDRRRGYKKKRKSVGVSDSLGPCWPFLIFDFYYKISRELLKGFEQRVTQFDLYLIV